MEMRCYCKMLCMLYKDHVTKCAKIQQATGPHKDLLTIVKRRKLQWYGHVSRSSGLAKTILQGTVKGGRRQGRQRKRWEDNIREWTGLEFGKSQRAVENREKWKKTGCKIVDSAPTTLAVKGLMMMMLLMMMMMTMMMMMMTSPQHGQATTGEEEQSSLQHLEVRDGENNQCSPQHQSKKGEEEQMSPRHQKVMKSGEEQSSPQHHVTKVI